MTTIILTIIGILLAAAAALMVIFYGGDAFNAGSVGAQANTFQNAGTNVIAAVQLYKADGKTATPTVPLLKAGDDEGRSYLKEDPSLPSGAFGVITAAGSSYEVTGVDPAVCARINSNLKLTTAAKTALSVAAARGGKMGCNTADSVFFANL